MNQLGPCVVHSIFHQWCCTPLKKRPGGLPSFGAGGTPLAAAPAPSTSWAGAGFPVCASKAAASMRITHDSTWSEPTQGHIPREGHLCEVQNTGKALNSFFLPFSLFPCFLLQLRRRRCSSGEWPVWRGAAGARGWWARGWKPVACSNPSGCAEQGVQEGHLLWGAGVTSERGHQKIERAFLHTSCTVRGRADLQLLSATRVAWCMLPLASSLPTWAAEGCGDMGSVQLVAVAVPGAGWCRPSMSPFAAGPTEAGRGWGRGASPSARSHPTPPPHRTQRPRKATASLSSSYPTSQGLLSLSLSVILSPSSPMSHSCSSVKKMSPALRFPTSPPPSPPPPALGPSQRAPDRSGRRIA